jgi:hypothetical protein
MKIKIEELWDFNDCETCGGGSEYGGRIFFDEKLVWEYIPRAGCYDNEYFGRDYMLQKALELLGHEVENDD